MLELLGFSIVQRTTVFKMRWTVIFLLLPKFMDAETMNKFQIKTKNSYFFSGMH